MNTKKYSIYSYIQGYECCSVEVGHMDKWSHGQMDTWSDGQLADTLCRCLFICQTFHATQPKLLRMVHTHYITILTLTM